MTICTTAPYCLAGKRVWVAGHAGMVGSAIVRRLASESCEILTTSRAELDLRHQAGVDAWMSCRQPHVVVIAAATVGGILANDTRPAEFIADNIMIAANIIHRAKLCGVEKLLFLGSSCIYPRLAPQPIPESALLSGPLEPTNQWYAVAKIAGIKMCQAYRRQYGCDFISVMPTNLYGTGDNFDPVSSHVLPSLLFKAHRAKYKRHHEIVVWGSGTPRREFMYVDDLAGALVHLLKTYSDEEPVNVGVGYDIEIRELARMIMSVVGVDAQIRFDRSKPDGTPRKLMDSSRLFATGWRPETSLEDGLKKVYAWYLGTHGARQ
jgi:GDP-L-fucose synthase